MYLCTGRFNGVLAQYQSLLSRQNPCYVFGAVAGEAEHHGEVGPTLSPAICLDHHREHVTEHRQTKVFFHHSTQDQLGKVERERKRSLSLSFSLSSPPLSLSFSLPSPSPHLSQ